MFEIKHYDENGQHWQDATCFSVEDLNMYKDIQVSQGECILVYCGFTGKFLEDFEK